MQSRAMEGKYLEVISLLIGGGFVGALLNFLLGNRKQNLPEFDAIVREYKDLYKELQDEFKAFKENDFAMLKKELAILRKENAELRKENIELIKLIEEHEQNQE